jgi:hypothetical protein
VGSSASKRAAADWRARNRHWLHRRQKAATGGVGPRRQADGRAAACPAAAGGAATPASDIGSPETFPAALSIGSRKKRW